MVRRREAPPVLIVLLGYPALHSFSPVLHSAALRALGIPGCYVPLEVPPADFAAAFRGLCSVRVRGNITLPFKEKALPFIDLPSAEALRAGVVNAFWVGADGLVRGDNTDGEGFLRAARRASGRPLRGSKVLIAGAGGAGRAIAFRLAQTGAARLGLLNRDVERAERLREEIESAFPGCRCEAAALHPGARLNLGGEFDIIVNATSLGMRKGDPIPVDPGLVPGAQLCIDIVPAARETPLLLRAKAAGLRTQGGLEMLLQQGALSFARWFGRRPPMEAMRRALQRAARGGHP